MMAAQRVEGPHFRSPLWGKAAPALEIAARIVYAPHAMAKIIHLEEHLPKVELHVVVDKRVYAWLRHLQSYTGDPPEVMIASMLHDIMKDDAQAEGLTQH
jgi:hypothetical protein